MTKIPEFEEEKALDEEQYKELHEYLDRCGIESHKDIMPRTLARISCLKNQRDQFFEQLETTKNDLITLKYSKYHSVVERFLPKIIKELNEILENANKDVVNNYISNACYLYKNEFIALDKTTGLVMYATKDGKEFENWINDKKEEYLTELLLFHTATPNFNI